MSRSRELFVPPIDLDRTSGIPLRRQIYHQLAQAIRSGRARGEARLPSTRLMAKLLRVSRNTVLAAYDDLAADNLVRGQRGAATRVNGGEPASGKTWFGLSHVIRAAGYPARILPLADPDGNFLYLRV